MPPESYQSGCKKQGLTVVVFLPLQKEKKLKCLRFWWNTTFVCRLVCRFPGEKQGHVIRRHHPAGSLLQKQVYQANLPGGRRHGNKHALTPAWRKKKHSEKFCFISFYHFYMHDGLHWVWPLNLKFGTKRFFVSAAFYVSSSCVDYFEKESRRDNVWNLNSRSRKKIT